MPRVRHWQEDWMSYHLTTRTLNQSFYLAADKDKTVIVRGLDFFQQRGDFLLFGYVIMGNHLHIVLQPSIGRTLAEIARDLKKWTSRYNTAKPPNTSLWERRYDDNVIHTAEEMTSVLNYIHNNPVRAGLVARPEDYPWSSARNYAGRQQVELAVTTDWR